MIISFRVPYLKTPIVSKSDKLLAEKGWLRIITALF